jgi:hypothetical protein
MTTSTATRKADASTWRVHDATGWLGFAAAPTFALMAWIEATAPQTMMCASAPGPLSIDGMAWMYLLMSFFHLSPWLNLASRRPRPITTHLTT